MSEIMHNKSHDYYISLIESDTWPSEE